LFEKEEKEAVTPPWPRNDGLFDGCFLVVRAQGGVRFTMFLEKRSRIYFYLYIEVDS